MHDERQDKHNVNVTQQTGDGKWKMGDWHRVINFIEDKATQIVFGWKFREF